MSPMSTGRATALAAPFVLNGMELPNRIVMAPMTRQACPGGVPTAEVAGYYARRAAGGVGLIITEGTVIDSPGSARSDTVPRCYGQDALEGWSQVVSRVHAEGGRVIPQLWHVGADRQPGEGFQPWAPSVGPDAGPQHERLTRDQIHEIVASFARAARDAMQAGFDGIELHGAHGYLIDQFLWEQTNHRQDEYGGSPGKRARFAAEVVAACREATAPGFPIIFRYSQWKVSDFDARIACSAAELQEVLAPIASAGADAFHCSTRRFWEPGFPGSSRTLAGWTKVVTGKPVIAVGSAGLSGEFLEALTQGAGAQVAPLATAEELLTDGEIDLLAAGRALAQDPQWARKVLDGRSSELQAFDVSSLARLT